MKISLLTLTISTAVLLIVGVLSALIPAARAANLGLAEALRFE